MKAFVFGIAAPLLTSGMLAAAESTQEKTKEETKCDKPVAAIVIIDDQVNAPIGIADQIRVLQMPTPAQALCKVLQSGGCFMILDNDPLFWSLPGTAQPDLILRASVVELAISGKNLGEKASTAVGRYIGSYLGTPEADIPVLKSAAILIDVLCPKMRRSATKISARSNAEPPRGESTAAQNAEKVQQAFSEAAQGVVDMVLRQPQLCQSAMER